MKLYHYTFSLKQSTIEYFQRVIQDRFILLGVTWSSVPSAKERSFFQACLHTCVCACAYVCVCERMFETEGLGHYVCLSWSRSYNTHAIICFHRSDESGSTQELEGQSGSPACHPFVSLIVDVNRLHVVASITLLAMGKHRGSWSPLTEPRILYWMKWKQKAGT